MVNFRLSLWSALWIGFTIGAVGLGSLALILGVVFLVTLVSGYSVVGGVSLLHEYLAAVNAGTLTVLAALAARQCHWKLAKTKRELGL